MIKSSLTFKVAILAVGKTIKRLIGTISLIILVRLLSQEEFGTYKQILLLIGFTVALAEFGIPKSLLYFIPTAENKDIRDRYFSQSFTLLSIIGVICACFLYIFSESISRSFNNPSIEQVLNIYAPSVIFLLISQNYFNYVLISLNKHKSASYSYVFIGLPNAIGIVIAVVLRLPLIEVFIVSICIMASQYVVLIVLMKMQDVPLFKSPKIELIRKQWKYVLPLSFSLLAGIVSGQLDKLVISYYFLPAVFAVYSVGAMQVPFVGNLFESVNATLLPKIAEYVKNGNKKNVEELGNRGTRKVSLLIFPIFCFLLIYAEHIITLLYTSSYVGAVPVFRVYLFIILMYISFCNVIIMGSGRTGIILITTIFTLTLNVILNFIFVKHIGLIGPAIATIGTLSLRQVIFIIWVDKFLGYNISSLFPVKELIRIFFISLFSGIAVYPILLLNLPKVISLLMITALFILIYLIALIFTKTLLQEEINIINTLLYKSKLIRK